MAVPPGKRTTLIAVALAAVGMAAACKDSGLPGRNTPVTEAARAEWRYPLYQPVDAAAGAFQFEDQRWIPAATTVAIPERLLRPVAASQRGQLHALVWDQQPFTRLYISANGDEWTPVERL